VPRVVVMCFSTREVPIPDRQVGDRGDDHPDQAAGPHNPVTPRWPSSTPYRLATALVIGKRRPIPANQPGTLSSGSAETAKLWTSSRKVACSSWIRFHSRVILAMLSE
jgi:hypothetical protein